MTDQELARQLEAAGQAHVLRRLHSLDAAARDRLERQLRDFGPGLLCSLAQLARDAGTRQYAAEFEPAPVLRLDRPKQEVETARRAGEQALRAGGVAAFVVAGGQGARLRYSGPKGCYPIGPLSRKSLFQMHAEKVIAAGRRYGVRIPLCVMTSETNDAEIREFFEGQRFFGLAPDDLFFCRQRMLPAFDRDGRVLFDAPDHLFFSPDGHGGSYFALAASGALDEFERRGIRHISYFQVDNPLAPPVDPLFIGEHVRSDSDMSSKVLRKRDPLERLGVFGCVGGGLRVIEYSEMHGDLQRKTLSGGHLKYAYGSIAVHVFDVAFARRMAATDLPLHLAWKPIPHLDEHGRMVEPASANGVKFERFVFDGVPLARRPVILEVRREEEFAPVKEASGEDTPESARAALRALHREWLRAAGFEVPEDWTVEISPLFALDAEEVRARAGCITARDGMYLH